jgi:hypothetical protein
MKDLRMGSFQLISKLLAFEEMLAYPLGYAYPRLRIAALRDKPKTKVIKPDFI